MALVHSASALREQVSRWHDAGDRVAFVPTMGNLHAGHLALVDCARQHADRVVASVFVNPTQFGPDEDFDRYPRTLAADHQALAGQGCDLLFAPDAATMYPFGVETAVRIEVSGLREVLEGAHRPGHFDGVATVVARLLGMVQPDVAVFGRKDYQQWRLIERMCRDLAMSVQIIAAPIVRAADGLALSSRNQYLDARQRQQAPQLHATLVAAADEVRAGRPLDAVEARAAARLAEAGFVLDYVAVRDAVSLQSPEEGQRQGLVVLAAARLGNTRLIDNIEIGAAQAL